MVTHILATSHQIIATYAIWNCLEDHLGLTAGQNVVVYVVIDTHQCASIELQWLPEGFWFNVLIVTYKGLHTMGMEYLQDCLSPISASPQRSNKVSMFQVLSIKQFIWRDLGGYVLILPDGSDKKYNYEY